MSSVLCWLIQTFTPDLSGIYGYLARLLPSEALLLTACFASFIAVCLLIALFYERSFKTWRKSGRKSWCLVAMANLFHLGKSFRKTSTIVPTKVWSVTEEAANMLRQLEESQGYQIKQRLEAYRDHDERRMQGWSRIWTMLSLSLLVASWAGGTMLAIHDHHKIAALQAQVSEYKKAYELEHNRPNVIDRSPSEVLERIDKKSFRARYNNPNTGELIEFVVTTCPEHPEPTNEIQAGVTLPILEWVEDTEHKCMILDGKWAGYTLLRNGVKPILTAFKEN